LLHMDDLRPSFLEKQHMRRTAGNHSEAYMADKRAEGAEEATFSPSNPPELKSHPLPFPPPPLLFRLRIL
jgi:hypothetical protein